MQGNARKRYLSLRQTDDDDQALFRTLNPQDSCFAAAVVLRASGPTHLSTFAVSPLTGRASTR